MFHRKTKLHCCLLTQYSHRNITQYGNKEQDAAHNVCAAPTMEKVQTINGALCSRPHSVTVSGESHLRLTFSELDP